LWNMIGGSLWVFIFFFFQNILHFHRIDWW
jgi:hypothetical protein